VAEPVLRSVASVQVVEGNTGDTSLFHRTFFLCETERRREMLGPKARPKRWRSGLWNVVEARLIADRCTGDFPSAEWQTAVY
jgi:hypothetical protein